MVCFIVCVLRNLGNNCSPQWLRNGFIRLSQRYPVKIHHQCDVYNIQSWIIIKKKIKQKTLVYYFFYNQVKNTWQMSGSFLPENDIRRNVKINMYRGPYQIRETVIHYRWKNDDTRHFVECRSRNVSSTFLPYLQMESSALDHLKTIIW